MPRNGHPSTPETHLVAGAIASFISCVSLQPFDVIKTRLQEEHRFNATSRRPYYKDVIRKLLRDSGYLGLWRGTVPTILRNVPGTAMYFALLSQVRKHPIINNMTLPGGTFIAGAFSRTAIGLAMMPITVVKVRFESNMFHYAGVGSALRDIYVREGTKGMFTGSIATALRDAPSAGLYVWLYEGLRHVFAGLTDRPRSDIAMSVNMASAASAGLIATSITNPFDLVKTRLQLQPNIYVGMTQASRRIWHEEGALGFFKGLGPRLARKSVSGTITWTIYEEVLKWWEKSGLNTT